MKLFVGDVDESLAELAKQQDVRAFLIDRNNFKQVLLGDVDCTVAYTSLGDLVDLESFYLVLSQSTKIVYCPPNRWSDDRTVDVAYPTSSVQGLTENVLLVLSDRISIEGLELCHYSPKMLDCVDRRKSSAAQIWIAGCSISHGDTIDQHQRYGQLLSNALGMPASFLTWPGSSIPWAADQIMRSDIRQGDIVVWGITSTERLVTCQGQSLSFRTALDTSDLEIDRKFLLSETNFYHALLAIKQVHKFCKNIDCQLLMIGLLTSDNLLRYLKSLQNYWHFPHTYTFRSLPKNCPSRVFIDTGSDGAHPGPKQHQAYADFILSKLHSKAN